MEVEHVLATDSVVEWATSCPNQKNEEGMEKGVKVQKRLGKLLRMRAVDLELLSGCS